MTETEWLHNGSSETVAPSDKMLEFLRGKPGLGRKRRLLAVACCHRLMKWMPAECLPAVELAEKLADGLQDEETRLAIFNKAGESKDEQADLRNSWAGYCAYRAAGRPSNYDDPKFWHYDDAASVAQVGAYPESWIDRKWDNTVLAVERKAIADLVRDIFGNPFCHCAIQETWLTTAVVNRARAIYQDRTFEFLPFLADELEKAGCRDANLLNHCRQSGTHVRGCWAVDLVLGNKAGPS
jgi:hypothetical protein